ncbi:DUF461 domain-containing protein [Streptacidiphilus sp. N1-12]|uniref:DUF461 domain-containing protein n=2 Tax=Streptacidiphilus alkalitolerans TaxID=3342712 RepID=A0ABV6V6Y7_9ACTN
MSRSLRRGAVAAVIIATAPILAACSAGDSAATLQVKPDNAATSIPLADGTALKLNGITVVTDATGKAPASVVVNIANGGPTADTLTGVTVDGVPAVLSGSPTIPSLGSLALGAPGQASATVPTLTATPGQNTAVSFTFTTAGSAQVQALVTTGTGEYASYAPSPSPTPTPTPVATATATATSTATATATSTKKP